MEESIEQQVKRVVEQIKTQRLERAKALEGIPVEKQLFLKEELETIVKVNQLLHALMKRSEVNRKSPKEALTEIQYALDHLKNFWESKFTSGGVDTEREDDSLYYMTASGISLRLKRANLSRGIRAVVQPFLEKVCFLNESSELSEKPVIGSTVEEYASQEFLKIQHGEIPITADVESKILKYVKNGKLIAVGNAPDGVYHGGNLVNKIVKI